MSKTLRDLTREMDRDQALAHLDTVKSYFHNAINHIENLPRNNKSIIHINLCNFSISRLTAIQNNWDQSIESVASSCRYFFETNLLFKFLEIEKENYDAFEASIAFDEIEIYEGILTIRTLTDRSPQRQVIESHIEDRRQNLSKHNYQQFAGKHKIIKNLRKLAEVTSSANEYEGFYKLFSKYLHPSSWIVNGTENNAHSFQFKNLFLIQSQVYAGEIIERLNRLYNRNFIGG